MYISDRFKVKAKKSRLSDNMGNLAVRFFVGIMLSCFDFGEFFTQTDSIQHMHLCMNSVIEAYSLLGIKSR